ncbi:MAG: TIGR01777 family protein [Desulfobacter sp.]|nr:MAG: TIGR01777 family protein [Desulfobacter sp.]
MDKIMITGASGFVGRYLALALLEQGHHVTGLGTSSRHPFEQKYDEFKWVCADTSLPGPWQEGVAGADIIINLAGRSIFHPWTKAYKQAIYDSRVLTTRNLVSAMGEEWSGLLLSASAAGFYGDRGDTLVSETEPCGEDFLARVCRDWEAAAARAEKKGAKVALMRFGVVLGRGGALNVMGKAFKFFVGGPLGSGRQWFPWIHIEDLGRAVAFLMAEGAGGTFNFTGPQPLRQKEFARALGRAMNRPAFMPAPSFMVKLVMGELGASLLQSQKVLPTALESAGFSFRYHAAEKALGRIYQAGGPSVPKKGPENE